MCVFCGVQYVSENDPSVAQAEVTSVFEVINNIIKHKQQEQAKKQLKTCPTCGTTIQDIAATTSRIGCPDCYTHFKDELTPFIKNYHKSLQHVGKSPKRIDAKDLKKALEEAIKKEDYELAAKLRDEIKNLE
jgi:protein arginine kinase activator